MKNGYSNCLVPKLFAGIFIYIPLMFLCINHVIIQTLEEYQDYLLVLKSTTPPYSVLRILINATCQPATVKAVGK